MASFSFPSWWLSSSWWTSSSPPSRPHPTSSGSSPVPASTSPASNGPAQCPVDHTNMSPLTPDHPFYKHQQEHLKRQATGTRTAQPPPSQLLYAQKQGPVPDITVD